MRTLRSGFFDDFIGSCVDFGDDGLRDRFSTDSLHNGDESTGPDSDNDFDRDSTRAGTAS